MSRKQLSIKCMTKKMKRKSGDKIEIMEARPLSKTKRWNLLQIFK
ncbi:MAG: 30S ribosomal protein S17 [Candidatus Anammoxibacter sp.]